MPRKQTKAERVAHETEARRVGFIRALQSILAGDSGITLADTKALIVKHGLTRLDFQHLDTCPGLYRYEFGSEWHSEIRILRNSDRTLFDILRADV